MHRPWRTKVYLNVYELLSFDKYNGYLVPLGLGAYHTGVEVYGEEFSFGYHDGNFSGIFAIEPRTAPDCRFSESILIGETDLSYAQVKRIVEDMGDDYYGTSYNIFHKNCNHFTSEFSRRLTGASTPSFTNRLAALGSCFKCFLPIDSTGQATNIQAPSALDTLQGDGHRLTDDDHIQVPLDDNDMETRRLLMSKAAEKRAGY